MRTLLISHLSHSTVMTMGSSMWGWMSVLSFSKKVIMDYGALFSPSMSGSSSIFKIWRSCLLRLELVYLPPGESSCYGVKGVAHNFTALTLRWLLFFFWAKGFPRHLSLVSWICLTPGKTRPSHISLGIHPRSSSWFLSWVGNNPRSSVP